MRRSNLATLVYLLVVFASGAVVGGFADRLYMAGKVTVKAQAPKTRAQLREEYLTDMRSRLHLNETQVAQLEQIADATGRQMHEMHKTIENDHIQKVTAMLDDNQKAEYAKMREEREKKRQQEAGKK
jgi:hypothetical protein